jgi:pimeloyl-ACP methyl ester carboxylesterase
MIALPFDTRICSFAAMTSHAKRPWYSPLRLAQRAVIYAAVMYVTLCVFLYFQQDSMIYPAMIAGGPANTQIAIRQAADGGLVPWPSSASPSDSYEGFVTRDFAKPARRGTIMVFHGNGSSANQLTFFVEAFRQRGFRTFLYEYPGYSGRPGHPRETVMAAEARKIVRELDAQGLGPVYLWGESLGSGVASSVAGDPTLPVHGLMLMMPWDTIAHVAQSEFPIVPVRLLLHDTYDSVANLDHFRHPICVIRGDQDTTVPPACTLNLFAHLPDPKLMILQAGYGHGDWPSEPNLAWWDEALNFIAPQAGKK